MWLTNITATVVFQLCQVLPNSYTSASPAPLLRPITISECPTW